MHRGLLVSLTGQNSPISRQPSFAGEVREEVQLDHEVSGMPKFRIKRVASKTSNLRQMSIRN